ncbi:MAG: acetylornithine deacetylase [Pseudomonadota bacterium]
MATSYSSEAMLARLIGFPTVSRDSNLPLIDFVREYLAGYGVESRLVPNGAGTKANLYAQIGPDAPGGVILSGHTDVVPVDGQDWTTDPFALSEREGKLFGRGTCDMKGFNAIALAMVPEMVSRDLKRPVQIALSYDEEIGCLGVPDMVRAMRETLPPAEAVIVGEPTMMEVVTQHKGGIGLTTWVRGFPVHSSQLHLGVSAIMTAARLVDWHNQRNAQTRSEAVGAARGETRFAFNPPWTTFHVGLIQGGTASNITAEACSFTTDIRHLPEEDGDVWLDTYEAFAAEIDAEIRAIRPEAGVTVERRFRNPGCRKEPAETARAEALARQLTGDNGEHAVAYGTEAAFFQEEGYSVCICGPGSIDQAHQADEFITRDQVAAGEAFMRRLIDRLAA